MSKLIRLIRWEVARSSPKSSTSSAQEVFTVLREDVVQHESLNDSKHNTLPSVLNNHLNATQEKSSEGGGGRSKSGDC